MDDQILNDNQNQIPESEPAGTPVSEPKAEDTAVPALEPAATDETEISAELSDTEAEPSAPETPTGPQRAWYAVHCYSGYENKVKKGLEQRIRSMGMQDNIFRVVVPTEDEIDVREGQRKVIQRRVFPGYILVEMIMTEESWYVVRNTPGVTGFVSSGDKPAPLREEEVSKILKRMETDQPKVRVTYRPGQAVRIVDGPFTDFRGTVEEVNMEKGKVRVLVSMFGRETPLELDLLQVEKV